MSLNSIMNIGVSGLMTAQDQLRVVSDNIANINTPGYIRKVAHQNSVVTAGVGMGVQSSQVTLAADRFLQAAGLKATSASGQSDISYELLDQIQAQFGDITDSNNLFNQGSATLSAMAQVGEDPTSSAGRQQAISYLTSFLNEGDRISQKIQTIRSDADARIATDVGAVNDLLKNITKLNSDISSATVSGGDATGAQTTQMGYIDQLAKLIDVQVVQTPSGGINIRTQSGQLLSGDDKYATLNYQATVNVDASTNFNPVTFTTVNGEVRDLADSLSSGELKGLLDVRDKSSVAVNDQLNEYVNQFANQVNAAHNASSAVPAPAVLTGKNTNLLPTEAVKGFTGSTNIVTLDSSGNVSHTLNVNFNPDGSGNGTYSLDGGASGTFSAATFISDLNTPLSGIASLSMNNGVLSVTASGSSGNDGVAIVDPQTGGSTKLGQGFSQFFGLNDLVTSDVPTQFKTGLSATDASGFNSGTINFSLKTADGAGLANIDFTPPGGDMATLVTSLNDTTSGLGRYGTFSLDGNGQLSFKGFGSPANTLSIGKDTTSRNGTGDSFSLFFGLGGASGNLATHLQVADRVNNDAQNLALAHVNLNTAGGLSALSVGDGSGGLALAAVASNTVNFNKTGLNAGGQSTLQRYGSDLAGQIGNLAANAKTNMQSNQALLTEATSRRSAYEGVNLDEELINLTTYQQAYSAAGRLVQAAKDMYDILLNMV
ncbi:MAG: flagellar hook-associated protein FlgK [Asticcacaulis sp.]